MVYASPVSVAHGPPGANRYLAQKAWEIPGAKGAKEKFYKAPNTPKLIYTVILWYHFVVNPPPPPLGGSRHDVGGEITREDKVALLVAMWLCGWITSACTFLGQPQKPQDQFGSCP